MASAEIQWEAPPGCPQQASIEAAVQRWLAQSPERLDAGAVRVAARILRRGTGFELELELESPSGHSRERLRAERCETFLDVVALKVMLAASPPGLPEEASEPVPAPDRDGRRADERSSAQDWAAGVPASDAVTDERAGLAVGFGFRVLAGAAFGTLPGIGPNLAVVGSLELSAVRLELGAAYGFPRTTRYPSLPAVGAELQLLTGMARLCLALLQRPLELPICAGLELGAMRGRGFGVSETFTSDQLWSAALLGPALRVPLAGPAWVWIEIDVLAALSRARYRVRNLDPLYESERVAMRTMAGVDLALW